jgi:hypothetical protein
MAEPITVDNGSLTDYSVLVDDVTDGTLGAGAKQIVGIMDATVNSTNKLVVSSTGAASMQGSVAHGSADSGNPQKLGAKTVAHGANPSAVAAANRSDLYANRHGILFQIGGHPNSKSATYITTGAQTDDNVMAAISTGTKYAVTRLTVSLDEATTVGVACRLGFGTATIPALGASGADAVDDILIYHPGLVPGAVITIGDGSGILGVGGDGAELRITCEAPTSGTLAVTATYFTIES